VLGFVVAEVLYEQFPDRAEGYLTRLRAKLVNGRYLARCARSLDVGTHLLLSDNMDQADGRANRTILADAFEALIGALYLDQGLPAAYQFIVRTMLDSVDLIRLAERQDNYKSLLLEYAQARGWPQPAYRVVHEEGPSHAMIFTVEVLLHGEPYGEGRARSKKRAEQQAAEEALDRLEAEDEG
jgi:ribonuclease-3